ncbi:MAG: hypothetical protein ABI597_10005 [Gammaproteobacteria bacterium]
MSESRKTSLETKTITVPKSLKLFKELSSSAQRIVQGASLFGNEIGLKPKLNSSTEKQITATLNELSIYTTHNVPSIDTLSVHIKNFTLKSVTDVKLNYYIFTPASKPPSQTEQPPLNIEMALLYVPGNLETVAGQYRNKYLQSLCYDLQAKLQATIQQSHPKTRVQVKASLVMMDYLGMGSNKTASSNYSNTPLDTDATHIANLIRELADTHAFPIKQILVIGHSLGGYVAMWAKHKLDNESKYQQLKILLDRTYGHLPFVGDRYNDELIAGGYMLPLEEINRIVSSSPGIIALKVKKDSIMRRNSLVDTLQAADSEAKVKGRLWDSVYCGSKRSSLTRSHQASFQELTLGIPWLTPIELMAALLSETPITLSDVDPRKYFFGKLTDFENVLNKKYKLIFIEWLRGEKFEDVLIKLEFTNLSTCNSAERVKNRHKLYSNYHGTLSFDANEIQLKRALNDKFTKLIMCQLEAADLSSPIRLENYALLKSDLKYEEKFTPLTLPQFLQHPSLSTFLNALGKTYFALYEKELEDLSNDCHLAEAVIRQGNKAAYLIVYERALIYAQLLQKLSGYFDEAAEYEKLSILLSQDNWNDIFSEPLTGFNSPESKALICEIAQYAPGYDSIHRNIQNFNAQIEKLKSVAKQPMEETKQEEKSSHVSLSLFKSDERPVVTYHFKSTHAGAEVLRKMSKRIV